MSSTGFYREEGRASPPEAVRAARRFGVDLSGHSSRFVDPRPGSATDTEGCVVFVMTPEQRERWRRTSGGPASPVFVLGDFDPARIETRRIRDPFGQPDAVFDAVFDRIQRCIHEVAWIWEDAGVGVDPDCR